MELEELAMLLMSMASALLGAVFFIDKKTLLGECLSHTAFPGAVMGVIVSQLTGESYLPGLVLTGGLIGSYLGYYLFLRLRKHILSYDASMVFILSGFFGIGLLLLSYVQAVFPQKLMKLHSLLFGHEVAVSEKMIGFYFIFAAAVFIFFIFFFKPIEMILFDRQFSKQVFSHVRLYEMILFNMLVFGIVVNIQSIGIILMLGMLIAPPIAARQFSNRMSTIFLLSVVLGGVSHLGGHWLSLQVFSYFHLVLPIGPLIIICAGALVVLSLLFSKEKGVLLYGIRKMRFYWVCMEENILKCLLQNQLPVFSLAEIRLFFPLASIFLLRMRLQKLIIKKENKYHLTKKGKKKARHILHLHSLWEAYLEKYIGGQKENIHMHAEEMEHVISSEIEKKLHVFLRKREQNHA